MYINESLGIYPRFDGDIQLIDSYWQPGQPLPEGWEPVVATNPPEVGVGEVAEETAPIKIDGVWHRQWITRKLTEEELETIRYYNEKFKEEINAARQA